MPSISSSSALGPGLAAPPGYDLASQLGLPTGLMATLASGVSEQNAMMIAALMARYDAVRLCQVGFHPTANVPGRRVPGGRHRLTALSLVGAAAERWPPARVPHRQRRLSHRRGVRSPVDDLQLKDEDGLYTDDPKKNPRAEFIPRITVSQLMARDFWTSWSSSARSWR